MGNDASKDATASLSRFSVHDQQAIQNLFTELSGKDRKQLTEPVLKVSET